MKKRLSVLLTGYIGNNNLGDDLMMMETIRYFQEKYPDVNLTVLVRYQGCRKRQDYGRNIKVINLHFFRIGKIKEWIYGRFLLRRYDLVLWVGGTCFADIGGDGLYSYFRYNIRERVPFGYLGVGIDYFENSEKRARAEKLLTSGNLAVFRDKISLKEAKKLACGQEKGNTGLFLAEDIVYRTLDREMRSIPKKNRLLVSWRYQSQYMDAGEEAKRMGILIDAIMEIAHAYREIVFLPIDECMDAGVNIVLAKNLKRRYYTESGMPQIFFVRHMDAREKVHFIAESEAYICGRLHGVMIGELAGCNVAALDYSLKMKIFVNSINRQCDAVPVGEMTKEGLLTALSNGAMADGMCIGKGKRAESDKNFEYLAKVIDDLKCRKETEIGN